MIYITVSKMIDYYYSIGWKSIIFLPKTVKIKYN